MGEPRKLGAALKAVVSDEYRGEEGGAASSVLMNANRRQAFEYVAWHPFCTGGEAARALGVSGPTAAWHLRKLAEAGYVREMRRGRRRLYRPAELPLEDGEASALAALAEPGAPSALMAVLRSSGLTGGQIAQRLGRASAQRPLRALAAAGLVAEVADGRYRRYYPGRIVSTLEENAPKRLREFRLRLLRRLERDRLAPRTRAAPRDVMEIDVRFGDERATMRLPMTSLLAGRLGGSVM